MLQALKLDSHSSSDSFRPPETMSGCRIVTESDTDLEVEYLEQAGRRSDMLGSSSGEEEGTGTGGGMGPGAGSRGGGGGGGGGEDESLSDSNTVNQDEDSFSILDGDSLLEAEGPQPEMPPLFVHLTCSVNIKNSHGSMPIQTLPTCLGETDRKTYAQALPGHTETSTLTHTHTHAVYT